MPWARMIRARGIQSVSSPSIKWPMLSKGLKVPGPSVPGARAGPTFCSGVRSAPGVRPRTSIALRRSKAISRNLSLPVYAVHETRDHRGQKQRRHNQEDAARVEGKDAGEHLATICVRRVHRTHPAQQHGGVEKRITPRQGLVMLVAFHAGEQRHRDERGSEGKKGGHAPREASPRDGGGGGVFVDYGLLGARGAGGGGGAGGSRF